MIQFIRRHKFICAVFALFLAAIVFHGLNHHHAADHSASCAVCHATGMVFTAALPLSILAVLIQIFRFTPAELSFSHETAICRLLQTRAPPARS